MNNGPVLETKLQQRHNYEDLEKILIGSLIFDHAGYKSIKRDVPDFCSNYFKNREYRKIFSAMEQRASQKDTWDSVTLSIDLNGSVPPSLISSLMDWHPGVDPVRYASQLKDEYLKEQLSRELSEIQRLFEDDVSYTKIIENLSRLASDLSKVETPLYLNRSILPMSDFLKMHLSVRKKILPFLPEGGLIMIYGPRGVGKTYFVLTLVISLICGTPFLRWAVSTPSGVLLIDGEMCLHDLRERIVSLLPDKPAAPFYILSHEYFYTATEKDLNLGSPDVQAAIQAYIETHHDIKVIVFDNLSCLLPGVREDKRDEWTSLVLPFLLWLRRRGISVVLIHHSGKGGDQRGTSSREDALDTIIRLDRVPSVGHLGAQFVVRFVKSRGTYGEEVSDIEARLEEVNGSPVWTWKPVEQSTKDRLLRLTAEGIETVSDAAEELGVSRGLVSRLKTELQREGRLAPGKELRIIEQSKGQGQ